jgi:hypothetical protein
MSDSAESDAALARQAFCDAVNVWRLCGAVYVADVIDTATECLVAGLDSPSLRMLAGASPHGSMFELDPLIRDTLDEMGLSGLLDTNVQLEALRAVLRRFEAGALSARELASWAHANIGHDGPADSEPFVALDDMYDEAEYLGYSKEELDEWAAAEAKAFLAGLPSPQHTARYGTPVRSVPSVSPRPPLFRRLGDRVRRHP